MNQPLHPYLTKEASRKRVEAFLLQQVRKCRQLVARGHIRVWDEVHELPRPVAEAIIHGVHHGTDTLGWREAVDRLTA